jgi:CRISPR-associated protein Cmr6
VTGTGNSHPVENGFLWHHTLSTPYMQGSAVKGIMRSWLENQLGYGAADSDDQQTDFKVLQAFFGSDHKDPKKQTLDQQAGNLIFFDALPIAQPELKVEIMTPHMGNYYADKGETAPADWHSPTPIPLLAVKQISLLFCIAPRLGKIEATELAQLSTALQNALANMGAGAKTQTGFGRLKLDIDKTEKLKKTQEEKAKQEAFNNASEEEKITTQAANMIQHCKTAKVVLENYAEYPTFIGLVKQTEQWQDEHLFNFWQKVVLAYAELKFPQPIDKNKRKDFAKDFRKKYPWFKAPQS